MCWDKKLDPRDIYSASIAVVTVITQRFSFDT